LSPGALSDLKNFFSCKKILCCFQNLKRNRKKFSAALHIMSKAARIISRQNAAKQAISVDLGMHSIAIIARNRRGL
jgi:hypothetical protein